MVLQSIATYINERKVETVAEDDAMAGDYVLTHGGDNWHPSEQGGGGHGKSLCVITLVVKENILGWKEI